MVKFRILPIVFVTACSGGTTDGLLSLRFDTAVPTATAIKYRLIQDCPDNPFLIQEGLLLERVVAVEGILAGNLLSVAIGPEQLGGKAQVEVEIEDPVNTSSFFCGCIELPVSDRETPVAISPQTERPLGCDLYDQEGERVVPDLSRVPGETEPPDVSIVGPEAYVETQAGKISLQCVANRSQDFNWDIEPSTLSTTPRLDRTIGGEIEVEIQQVETETTWTISCTASNSAGQTTDSIRLTVRPNSPPILPELAIGLPSNVELTRGTTVSGTCSSTDVDDDAISYAVTVDPESEDAVAVRALSQTSSAIVFELEGTADRSGSAVVSCVAQDDRGGTSPAASSTLLFSANMPPVPNLVIESSIVTPGEPITTSCTGQDPDGDDVEATVSTTRTDGDEPCAIFSENHLVFEDLGERYDCAVSCTVIDSAGARQTSAPQPISVDFSQTIVAFSGRTSSQTLNDNSLSVVAVTQNSGCGADGFGAPLLLDNTPYPFVDVGDLTDNAMTVVAAHNETSLAVFRVQVSDSMPATCELPDCSPLLLPGAQNPATFPADQQGVFVERITSRELLAIAVDSSGTIDAWSISTTNVGERLRTNLADYRPIGTTSNSAGAAALYGTTGDDFVPVVVSSDAIRDLEPLTEAAPIAAESSAICRFAEAGALECAWITKTAGQIAWGRWSDAGTLLEDGTLNCGNVEHLTGMRVDGAMRVFAISSGQLGTYVLGDSECKAVSAPRMDGPIVATHSPQTPLFASFSNGALTVFDIQFAPDTTLSAINGSSIPGEQILDGVGTKNNIFATTRVDGQRRKLIALQTTGAEIACQLERPFPISSPFTNSAARPFAVGTR